jgi:hypothetical protein
MACWTPAKTAMVRERGNDSDHQGLSTVLTVLVPLAMNFPRQMFAQMFVAVAYDSLQIPWLFTPRNVILALVVSIVSVVFSISLNHQVLIGQRRASGRAGQSAATSCCSLARTVTTVRSSFILYSHPPSCASLFEVLTARQSALCVLQLRRPPRGQRGPVRLSTLRALRRSLSISPLLPTGLF